MKNPPPKVSFGGGFWRERRRDGRDGSCFPAAEGQKNRPSVLRTVPPSFYFPYFVSAAPWTTLIIQGLDCVRPPSMPAEEPDDVS